MSVTILTIIALISIIVYFAITWIWMRFTLRYKYTLNYHAFKYSLEKDKTDFMHYIEVAFSILLVIGFLTTIISQVQILVKERNGKH